MRLGFLLLVLVALVFGSAYWYEVFNPVCKTPVYYRIGSIDERFGTNEEELKRIAQNAERVWEESLGTDLFIYADDGELPINLIFDERQKNADLEQELRQDLEAKEGMSETVAAQYEGLIANFRELKREYESEVLAYETKLRTYNTKVSDWNSQGGAPPDEVAKLKAEQRELTEEQEALEARARELNTIVAELNQIGAKGNMLITDYNKIVNDYNTRFAESHEYTQGDHSIEAINVYQFNTEEELTLVLAHEMGHAISLGHVENEESIMHRLMGGQDATNGLTPEDKAEFENVCTDKGFVSSLISLIQNAF